MSRYHKHKELIVAWAHGSQIEFFNKSTSMWEEIDKPDWSEDINYRVFKVRSSLTHSELVEIARDAPGNFVNSYTAIADAAVQRYINDQQRKLK